MLSTSLPLFTTIFTSICHGLPTVPIWPTTWCAAVDLIYLTPLNSVTYKQQGTSSALLATSRCLQTDIYVIDVPVANRSKASPSKLETSTRPLWSTPDKRVDPFLANKKMLFSLLYQGYRESGTNYRVSICVWVFPLDNFICTTTIFIPYLHNLLLCTINSTECFCTIWLINLV